MSLQHGVRHGVRHGNPMGGVSHGVDGQGSFSDFNFWLPEQQSFPASVAEVAALGWSSTPLGAWACQDAAGTTLADFSGNGHTLTQSGSATATLTGQQFVGPFDGKSFRSQKSFEAAGNTAAADRFAAASTTFLDLDGSGVLRILVEFRVTDGIPSSTRSILGKRNAGAGAGWYIGVFSDGRVFAFVSDGTTSSNCFASGNVCDGAPHWALVTYNPTTDLTTVDTDLATGASSSTAAINWANVSNAATFGFGGIAGIVTPCPQQTRGCIVWNNTDTSLAEVQAWWRYGRVPGWLTFTRSSDFHTVVEDDATYGEVLVDWGLGHVAYEYNSLTSTNPLKLGIASYSAVTNLIPNTDLNNTINFPATGTRTGWSADSPRGFREMTKHTGIAGQSILAAAANGAAVTAAATYTVSGWMRWNGVGTAPKIKVYRADGTTEIVSIDATDGTNRRKRYQASFVAPATEAVRFAFEGRDGDAWVFGPMINAGAYAKAWLHTKGGTASTVASVIRVTVPGLRANYGTFKVWGVCTGQNSASERHFVAAETNGGSAANERAIVIGASEHIVTRARDNATAVVAQAIGAPPADYATVESVVIGHWDVDERNGFSVRVKRSATVATDATNLPADAAITAVNIGMRATGLDSFDGNISKLRVYHYSEMAA